MGKRLTTKLVILISLVPFLILSNDVSIAGWEWQQPYPTRHTLECVWGTSQMNIFAVGEQGTILHYNGDTWTWSIEEGETGGHLNSIWGSSESDIYAVGERGT